jgi:hypothetical protein
MRTHRLGRIRRFRFNLPQRIAAVLLALFLTQGLWLATRQPMSESESNFARCGREVWERPATLAGSFSTCGDLSDGILAYRIAGLPLTLRLLVEEAIDHLRQPENRVLLDGGPGSVAGMSLWELRHRLTGLLLLMRLPFLAVGCLLGAALWWVARRLYGNLGGYTALALYCFSPALLRAAVQPNAEILASLAVYGGVYTCVGVAHAMQGPKQKWRPRIVLLAMLLAVAATAHLAALTAAVLLGLAFMLWLAEGRRTQILPVVLIAVTGAMAAVLLCYGFRVDAFLALFRTGALQMSLSPGPLTHFIGALPNAGLTLAAVAALALYAVTRRSRFFGNTAPLLCALILLPLQLQGVHGAPWLWALPFLLTFVGGVFADAFEGPRGRLMQAAAGAIVLLQAVFCVLNLTGLI